jgi:hypothetical protein
MAPMTQKQTPAVEENPHAGQGAVLLDIGGDVGALVVEMPGDMVGVEIEIRRLDHDHGADHGADHGPDHGAGQAPGHHHDHDHGGTHHPHVAVVARPGPQGTIPSLVFPELQEGTYQLTDKGGGPALATTTITGGEVTLLAWPG